MADNNTALGPHGIDEVDAQLPAMRRAAQAWLTKNNRSDARTAVFFSALLLALCVPVQAWWGVALAGWVLVIVPLRLTAARYFERGDVRTGLLISNVGSWIIPFPVVLIVPDAFAMSLIVVTGPLVLAAAFLESTLIRKLIPATALVATALTTVGLTAPGAGLDELVARPLYIGGMVIYTVTAVILVMADVREAHNVRLRLLHQAHELNDELVDADQALRESRQRLVTAADEERSRIERDLHDGAQQRLVALSVQLRLAADLTEEGAPVTGEHLRSLSNDAREAVQELREMARGLYPSRLHDLGLVASLRAVTQSSPVPVTVDDLAAVPLPHTLRLAVYFICLEAIQNAVKHGDDDTKVRVELTHYDDELHIAVTDTGPGFVPDEVQSNGLTNMADRAAAHGGELTITSERGTGSVVALRLPLDGASLNRPQEVASW